VPWTLDLPPWTGPRPRLRPSWTRTPALRRHRQLTSCVVPYQATQSLPYRRPIPFYTHTHTHTHPFHPYAPSPSNARLIVCVRALSPSRQPSNVRPTWLPARASRKPTFRLSKSHHTRLNPSTVARHVAPCDASGHHLLPRLRTLAPKHLVNTHH